MTENLDFRGTIPVRAVTQKTAFLNQAGYPVQFNL